MTRKRKNEKNKNKTTHHHHQHQQLTSERHQPLVYGNLGARPVHARQSGAPSVPHDSRHGSQFVAATDPTALLLLPLFLVVVVFFSATLGGLFGLSVVEPQGVRVGLEGLERHCGSEHGPATGSRTPRLETCTHRRVSAAPHRLGTTRPMGFHPSRVGLRLDASRLVIAIILSSISGGKNTMNVEALSRSAAAVASSVGPPPPLSPSRDHWPSSSS